MRLAVLLFMEVTYLQHHGQLTKMEEVLHGHNSLFEDNAEFGLGMRLSIDRQKEFASELLLQLKDEVSAELAEAIITAPQKLS